MKTRGWNQWDIDITSLQDLVHGDQTVYITPAFAGRQALNERCALIIGGRSALNDLSSWKPGVETPGYWYYDICVSNSEAPAGLNMISPGL